jgi:hypothetical protein
MDDLLEGEGIKSSIHLDTHPVIKNDPDAGGSGLRSRDKADESVVRRITIETAAPKVEALGVDSFLLAEGSPAHAALCMPINEGTPVDYSLFSAHHVTSCLRLQEGG